MLLAFLFRGFVCHQGLWSRDATQGARGEDEQAELHKARKAKHGEFEVFVLHFLVVFAVVIKVTYIFVHICVQAAGTLHCGRV